MLHGIINVYKEKGYTSHDVVAKLRGITGQRKIGHTGTLDPDAEGALPVCLGKATKLCDMLTDKDKAYETVLLLGQETDTQDTSGQVLNCCDTSRLDPEAAKAAVAGFVGDYEQIPPMYSARKVNGKKLYELAREGKTVARKASPVRIMNIHILEMNLPRIRMEVECSKGTYIRTLCHDIGQKLLCGGCMEELVRTRAGSFKADESVRLTEIQARKEEGTLQELIVPVDAMFEDYQKVVIQSESEILAFNGNAFPLTAAETCRTGQNFAEREKIRVYDQAGRFIAIYEYRQKDRMFCIVKMFFDRNNR